MNRALRWRRHWKLVAALLIVLALLLTVMSDIEITVRG